MFLSIRQPEPLTLDLALVRRPVSAAQRTTVSFTNEDLVVYGSLVDSLQTATAQEAVPRSLALRVALRVAAGCIYVPIEGLIPERRFPGNQLT